MKICILTSEHRVLDARIFYREAVSLAKQGHAVHVFGDHPKNEIIENVFIHAMPRSKSSIKRKIFASLNFFLRAKREKADIYHFHDPSIIPCGLLLRLLGNKVVMDVHEDFMPTLKIKRNYAPKTLLSTLAILFDRLEKLSGKIFSGVVTVSEEIERKFKGSNVVVARNFPILCQYKHKMKKKGEFINIIYTGTVTQVRGCWEILSAFKEFVKEYPAAKLSIAGKFESKQLEHEFREKASEIGSIDILGLLPWEETKNLQENADMGLLISHFKNDSREKVYPVKLFEYMSAGIPVIFSKKIFFEEMLNRYRFGVMVDGKNPSEIAEAMLQLAVDPNKRIEMGKSGREAVEKEFSWEKEFNNLNILYNNIYYRKKSHLFR